MAATTKLRLPGIVLALTMDGDPIGAWTNFNIDVKGNVATATAATSEYVQKVATTKDGTGSFDTFLGADAPILAVFDEIELLSIKEGANTVGQAMADATTFGKCRVTALSEKYMSDPATGTVSFEYGFID